VNSTLVVKSRGGVSGDRFFFSISPQFVPHRFLRIASLIVGAAITIILLPLLILIVFKSRFGSLQD
jgi:hypothetical protein